MALYDRQVLITKGYGEWAPHILRGALEETAKLVWTEQEVVELVEAWIRTPHEDDSQPPGAFRSVVLPTGEDPQEGDFIVRRSGAWTAEPVGLSDYPQAFTIDSVNAAGDPLQVTEGGVVTTYTYYSSGNVKTVTRLGVVQTWNEPGTAATVGPA